MRLAIQTIHATSRRTYGSSRVHAELHARGVRCGRKRVARLMRAAGLAARHAAGAAITWRFTTAAARTRLVRHYPRQAA